jgi:hypothetical protein
LIFFDVQVMTSRPAEPRASSMVIGKEALGSSSSVRPLGLAPMRNAQAIWHPFIAGEGADVMRSFGVFVEAQICLLDGLPSSDSFVYSGNTPKECRVVCALDRSSIEWLVIKTYCPWILGLNKETQRL